MIYSIVNAFLNNVTFRNLETQEQLDKLLVVALNDNRCLTPSIHRHVEEVFSPIFLEYPNGKKDRSASKPRDAKKYIEQWEKLTEKRSQPHGVELSEAEVKTILKRDAQDLEDSARDDQQDKKPAYFRSCAYAVLKELAGHTGVGKFIYALGLPLLPPGTDHWPVWLTDLNMSELQFRMC